MYHGSHRVSTVAFHPNDSNTLVSGSYDNTVKMWHVPSGECKATLEGHRYNFSAITCMGSLGDPSPGAALLRPLHLQRSK